MVVTFNPAISSRTSFTSNNGNVKPSKSVVTAKPLAQEYTAGKTIASGLAHKARTMFLGLASLAGVAGLSHSCTMDPLSDTFDNPGVYSPGNGSAVVDSAKTTPIDTMSIPEPNYTISQRLAYEADSLGLGTGKTIDSTAYIDGIDGYMQENKYRYINDSTAIIEQVTYPPTKPSRKSYSLIVSTNDSLGLGHKDIAYNCDNKFQPISDNGAITYQEWNSKDKRLYHLAGNRDKYATTIPSGKMLTLTQLVNSQTKGLNEYKYFGEQVTTGLTTVRADLPNNYKYAIQSAKNLVKTAAKNVR